MVASRSRACSSAARTGDGDLWRRPPFAPVTEDNVQIDRGVATDVRFVVRPMAMQETVTVTGQMDPVFSSSRTGAATSVTRIDIADLPTTTGRISDITRLTPQATEPARSTRPSQRPGLPPVELHVTQRVTALAGQRKRPPP